MKLKKIIIVAAAGMLSFSITFAVTWFLTPTKQAPPDTTTATDTSTPQSPGLKSLSSIAKDGTPEDISRGLTEKQLENLIYEVRTKIQEYKDKIKAIEVQEERIKIAEATLRKDVEKLKKLRTELSVIVANIKSEQEKLQKSLVEIASAESANLRAIASTYNRMAPESASGILINMSKMQTANGQSGLEDVVKILHYMEDRTKANLLAELSTAEPKLAALLCQKLKKIVETQ